MVSATVADGSAAAKCWSVDLGGWWVNLNGGESRLPMGLDMVFSLLWLQGIWKLDCGFWTRGFWLASKFGFFFYFLFFFNTFLVRDCGDASNRLVFALIPKLTQDNQNNIERTEK